VIEEELEIICDAWDTLIRPNFPPFVEPTAHESKILLKYTTLPGFQERMRERLLKDMVAEGTITAEEAKEL